MKAMKCSIPQGTFIIFASRKPEHAFHLAVGDEPSSLNLEMCCPGPGLLLIASIHLRKLRVALVELATWFHRNLQLKCFGFSPVHGSEVLRNHEQERKLQQSATVPREESRHPRD